MKKAVRKSGKDQANFATATLAPAQQKQVKGGGDGDQADFIGVVDTVNG